MKLIVRSTRIMLQSAKTCDAKQFTIGLTYKNVALAKTNKLKVFDLKYCNHFRLNIIFLVVD